MARLVFRERRVPWRRRRYVGWAGAGVHLPSENFVTTIPSFLPSYSVEIAFTTNPGSAPSWQDVSNYVRAFDFHRGRQDELARVEAATGTILLDNDDRRFDPTNTSSPHYPNVVPMRRVRIRVEWAGTRYQLFHGFVEAWTPQWLGDTGNDAVVDLRIVDLFKSLNLHELQGPAYSEELTGARIGHVLDTIGWGSERQLDPGSHTVAAERAASTGTVGSVIAATATGAALAYVQQIADAEPGIVFTAGSGDIVFQDRRHRLDDEAVSAATFGDDVAAGELNYVELGTDYDDSVLQNEVIVTYPPTAIDRTGVEIATSSASIARYLKRSKTYATRLVKPGEAAAVASLFLARYREASLRFPSISVEPVAGEWATILPLVESLSKRVTVKRRPPGGGTIVQDCHIEGYSFELTSDPWEGTVTFDLSPALQVTEWIVGTSQLGVNTYVGV